MTLARLLPILAMPLAACAPVPQGGNGGGPVGAVPEQVAALAAPNQPLATARRLEDGCYWYLHDGPVEQTLLPLRTVNGNPICVRTAS